MNVFINALVLALERQQPASCLLEGPMNKISMIFTALKVYRQARGQEGSTLRGAITGTLAAGAVVGLWYMGADLNAEQIGLVLAAITGIDAALKIMLPDQIRGSNNGKTNAAQNLGNADPVRVDPDPAHAADRLRQLPTDGGPREDSQPADELRYSVPADRRPGPTGATDPNDPNESPRFAGGFGDRD